MSENLLDEEKTMANTETNPGVETMDKAREVASTAVETVVPSPTYTSDEMKLRIASGEDYSQPEIDAMSDEEYGRYRSIGEAYLAANQTPEMQRQKLTDRLDAAEKLSKMAQFVVDNDEDGELAKKHGVSSYTADWLTNHGTSFANMSDADAQQVAVGIKSAYDEASKNRSHWQTFVDALKRGHSGVERMLYQGGSLLFGDGGNTEESRAIQRQTEIDDLSNPQKIGSTSNIRSFGDGLDFVLESFGENLERTGVGIAASTAGAVAGGVPGAIIAGSLGTTMLNAGEAVGDQLDEMEQDENMRFSRGAALGQTAWYSLLDGAFGIVPGMGKVWSKALQTAGKDVSKKAVVEMAKDIASREGLKNFGWNFFKTVGGEALQEPAQSQIGGRARRYFQTGSALTPEERKARENGESPVWQAIFDEAAGGAAAASILGGLGGAVDSAHASRVQKTFDNMFKVLGREELFNKMDPTTRILVSMRVANDALRTTEGVFSDEQKAALEAQSNDIDDYISELSGSGNESKKAIANSAREYLDILKSQFTNLSTDTASDIARSQGLMSSVDGTMLQNGEHKEYGDGSSANIYTDKTGIQIANKFAADGADEGWIVANAANRKSPMEPSSFKTPEEAVAYAQKLDLLNQVRDAETASKKQFIKTVFRNMYGERAPRLRFVDRPNAAEDNRDGALQAGALANYDPQQNVVRINTDAIENLGQLYTVLGHEKFHEDIAEYLLKEAIGPEGLTDEQAKQLHGAKQGMFGGDKVKGAKELYAKNPNAYVTSGKTDGERIAQFGEEMVTERASVADLVRQLRSTQRGALSSLAMKVGRAIGLKMANDLGVSPELITQKDVAEEIRHLWQNGYTGLHAEIQLPSETAKEKDGESINDYLMRQKGGEVVVQPTDVKSESAPVETAQNDNSVDQQTEDYYIDSDNVVNDNGYTYITEDKADGYAQRRPDLVRRPASDGMVKFEKKAETVEKPAETASTASVETETDNVPSEAPKASKAVSDVPTTEVEKTEDDELLDDILASAENYSATEAVKVEKGRPAVKVGDELIRDDIDEGRVNAENIVKDVDKRNLGLKNWVVDRISDDGRTIYLKPGKTDAQKKAAEIGNPLRGANGQLRKSFMGADLYAKAKNILTDERHTVESLRKVLDDFRAAENRLVDSVTFKNNGTKAAYDKLLDEAERRIGEMENQNRLNRGQAARERAQARRGEKTDTELKEMFKWWRTNDPSAETAWLGAFVGDSGKFGGIVNGVPKITWSKDASLTPRVDWENTTQDIIPASEIFSVTLDKNNEPTFSGKDTPEARFYSRFLFGMSPDEAVRYAIGVREGRNKAGTFNGLLTERITDIGLSEDAARDLETKYDDSSVIETLLNEYLDAEKAWDAHKRGDETTSERDMREKDEFLRNERERSEREALDSEAAQYLADYAIAEEEWAKADEYVAKLYEQEKAFAESEKANKEAEAQIANDRLNGVFKTAPVYGLMFKSAPKMSRDEEKKYVRSLGPKIYDDITGKGADAWAELYRLYRMGEGTKGGIDNWLRHLGVPEGKIDLLADHVWKKVEQTLIPSEAHSKIWYKFSPETIIGNAVVNTVKAWQRGGDALEEKGVSRNVANYDEGIGDDEGEITSKDELTSPDTFADIDQTTLYRSSHYRRNQERAISALSDYRNKMSEDRANMILAWQKAYYVALDRLMNAEDAKEDDARKVRSDMLANLTMRIAADSLDKPVGVYKAEMRELFGEMRKAEKEGKWDSLRVDQFDVPYTADELVDMMIADGRDEMAYAVESAEDGIENEAIANAWNKEHRNEIAKLAKTDRQKARKLAKSASDIRALLSKARADYGWKDQRVVSGNKAQTNMGLDVKENASAQDVKDFATRKLNMGLNEGRVAKMVAREFGMDEMKAANAASQASAARKRKAKGSSAQGDLFAGLEGTVEKKPKLSFWDQVKAINSGIVNGKTDDEIVSGITDDWTMDESMARKQIGKARERIAKRAEKAEGVAAAKAAKAEAKAKERADQLAKVKTYKVGDVALIPVNETGEAIPAKWDTDEKRRNAYLAVKESIGTDVPMEDVVQTVAETSGLEPLEIGRLYQSMYHGKRASYIGDIRAMTASGMADEDVVKAAVRTYGISEKKARSELDSAKLAVSTMGIERKGVNYALAKEESLASSEMADKLGPDVIEKMNKQYKDEQKEISEDRTYEALYNYYDKNVGKVVEELKKRGYSEKTIAGMSQRHLAKTGSLDQIGEMVGNVISAGKGGANFLGNLGLSATDVTKFERQMADNAMDESKNDALKAVQKLRSQGYTQAKAEKLVRDWGRRHMKPVNLSAAKAKAKDDAAKQELFGDLMAFKTSPEVLAMTDEEKRRDGVLKSYSGMRRYRVDIDGKWGLQHGMIIPESAEARKTFDRKSAAKKGIWAKSLRDAIHLAKLNYIYDNSPFAYQRQKGDLTIAEKAVYNNLSWAPVWIHGYEPMKGIKAPSYAGKNGDKFFLKRISKIEEKIDAFQEKEFANARRASSGSVGTDGQSGRAGRSGGVGDLQRGGRGVGAAVRGVGGGVQTDNGARGGTDVVRAGMSGRVANSGTITQPTLFKTLHSNARFYNNGTLRSLAYHTKDRNGRDLRDSFAAALGLRRDFEDGVVVTPETVRKVFYSFRPDVAQKVLFEQFMPFAEELGVSFRLFSKDAGQSGDELAGRVKYYVDVKDDVPTVILHELIHVPTAYAVSSYYNEPATTKVPVSKEMASAIDKLRLLFNENKGWLKDEYGVTNLKEFMAEMSNPSMRDALARRNLWEQIVDFFTDVFNAITVRERVVRGSKAYDDVVKALGDVLANGSQKTFDEFREATNNDPYAETNKKIDGIMFKTRASSEDLRYVFGARASLEAHGVAVPKEAVRPSKRDAELDVLADMAIKNDVYREKLVNRAYDGEAINDQEARELFLIARDQMAGVVSQRDGMNALNGKNMAEAEELSNISLERAITAMMRGFSTAGATLRQAQRGASLDEMRDLGVYLMAEVKATMAKNGIEGEIPQSVKDLVDKQAKELAAKNEEINAAQQKIAELTAKAEKADAERAIAEMKAKVAEPFKMSAEARERLSKKYGFAVSDSSVEAVNALARLAGILPKNVMAKGEGQTATLTDEVRECFGQIVSDADFDFDKAMAFVRDSLGNAYDEVFAAYRNEMEAEALMLGADPAKATVRTKAERQRKGFVKRHPKGRSVQMPLGLTLGGLQDRLEQERRNCRATMEASSDNDERTRSLGRYLRRFVQVRVAEDSSLTNDAILAAVAEEANRMDPDGEFTIQDAARIVSGAKGFDPATKEAVHSRLSVLKKAMGLAREGKFTEAARMAGVSLRTEAQMLEDMEKSLTNELDRLNRDVADILENPLPDEKESAERVKTLQDEIKETVETLRKMRDERTANEKKDSVLSVLSDRHRKIADALAYEKSLKDWETALTPDADRARQRIRRLESENRMMSAELSALRRDANLMRSLQRQIDEFQRRLDENDFEPAQKKSKPRIESYSEEVQKKIRERDQMRKAFKAARDSYQYRKLSKPVQVWKDALDILGETKALVGSMDLSSMFRQGGQLSWAHPLLFAKNFKKTLQVFASEDRAQQVMDEIRARDNAKYYERAGVEFTDWGVNATNADDRFVLNHYRKFTNAKLLKLGIEMSERAFSMYLNLMRADVFDRLAASAANPDLSTWSNDSLKALGNYINVASQRGMIDKQTAIGKAVPFLNNVLWSPRNIISRFQFLKETAKLAMPWADPYGSKELRGLFAKELLRYFAGVAAAIAFTKTMADLLRGDDEPPEDLELDPRSSNFLTVKIGNTHLDFLSGLKQIIVYGSRIATQKTKSTRSEALTFKKIASLDMKKMFRDVEDVRSNTELVGRFLRSKFAPGTGFAYDLATRETFERQDLEWLSLANNKEEKGVLWHALQQVVPLTFIDLYEQASLSGIPRTVITGLGTILGVGVQAYDPYTFKQLSGDYRYFKRLYHEANDPAERERLLEYHPMLKRAGSIDAQLKVVSGIKSTIRKREKANLPVDELKDALEREQKKAINLMAGFKNPGQVD